MKNEMTSEGQCLFCQKMILKSGINKHLNQHLVETENTSKVTAQAFHLQVLPVVRYSGGSKLYFINLLVDGGSRLFDLDTFLRQIWLECCGHMSSFRVKGKQYNDNFDDINADIGEKQSQKMSKIFEEGMILDYEYDFGSTTELQIKVVKALSLKVPESVQLLSRNEPLPILCDICQQEPATVLCSIHVGDKESSFCDSCGKKHAKKCEDFADYAELPIVNSPRLGECAYDGGSIDLERDGVFKIKK